MDRAREADLVKRAQRGDHRAFELLITPVRPIVYRRSLSATRDAHQADDIAQETMIRAYTKIKSFRGDSKFSTWVYTICQRCILMYFRSSKRKGAVFIADVNHSDIERGVRQLRSPEPCQEEMYNFNRKADSIEAAMRSLEPKYYQVIDLWLSGNTLNQIGDIANLTVPATKTRIHRARNQIRSFIEAA